MKIYRDYIFLILLITCVLLFSILSLRIGQVTIQFSEIWSILVNDDAFNVSWQYIIERRLIRTLTAIMAGGSLAISGLILQVYFRNPLAGPGVLGISSGASLGVALVFLGGLSLQGVAGYFTTIISGLAGALLILLLLLFVSKYIYQSVTLLVLGLMLSYFTSAILNVLYQWADSDSTREFVLWGLGSFEGGTLTQLFVFLMLTGVGVFVTLFLIKPLNGLALGVDYAKTMGVNIRLAKWLIIITTGVLTATVTAFCGPIGFLGIAVPQLTRISVKSKNHLMLLPITFCLGSFLALIADLSIRLFNYNIPLNTATALLGAPIIIWTIFKMNTIRNSNI